MNGFISPNGKLSQNSSGQTWLTVATFSVAFIGGCVTIALISLILELREVNQHLITANSQIRTLKQSHERLEKTVKDLTKQFNGIE